MFATLMLLLPIPAVASCAAGERPTYSDITYVYVRQYSLVGIQHPSYEFEAFLTSVQKSRAPFASASLNARHAVRYVGNFNALDARQAFDAVIAVLERNRFYDMRMDLTCCIIDGPEDLVRVTRCGVTTTLGTVSEGGEVDLEDAQGKAFLMLEDEVRSAIFAQKWTLPTPPP